MNRAGYWALVAPAALGWAGAEAAVAAIPLQTPGAIPVNAGAEPADAAGAADATGAYAKGRSLLAKGDPVKALEWFRIALREDPGSIEALNAMGVALDRVGRFDLARPYYETALALRPEAPDLLHNYGLSLSLQGRDAAAIPILRKAANLADSAVRASSLALLKRIEARHKPLGETMLAASGRTSPSRTTEDSGTPDGRAVLVRIGKGEVQLASSEAPTAQTEKHHTKAVQPAQVSLAEMQPVSAISEPGPLARPVAEDRPLARNAKGEVLVASLGRPIEPPADMTQRPMPKEGEAMAAAPPANPITQVSHKPGLPADAPQLVRIADGELWLATRRDPGDFDDPSAVPSWTERDELALAAEEQALEVAARQSEGLPADLAADEPVLAAIAPPPEPAEDPYEAVLRPLWLPPKVAMGEAWLKPPAHFLPVQFRRQVAMVPADPAERTPMPAPIRHRFVQPFVSDDPRLNAFADRMQRRGKDAIGRNRRTDTQASDELTSSSEAAAARVPARLPSRLRFKEAFQSDREQLNSLAELLVGPARAHSLARVRAT